ncbi:unnamed protein product [Amoebophrya sp. A120]|nr:unnamed protein product [Amoebophrya sp. A120]|eukprot:GSA120T00001467001.1
MSTAEETVLTLVRALADGKCTGEQQKQAERSFNELRDGKPEDCLSGLLTIMDRVCEGSATAALSKEDTAIASSALVLLKNTIPKVWSAPTVAPQQAQLCERLTTCFLKDTCPATIRKSVGHVIENILVSKDCGGDVRDLLRKELVPTLGRALDQNIAAHLGPVLQFLVDGMQGLVFFEQVCMPHQAKMEQLLLTDPSQHNVPLGGELRALLFLRIVEWTAAEKIPHELVKKFVPAGVLQVLINSDNTTKQKEILQAMVEAAGKNIFSAQVDANLLHAGIQACNQVAQKNEEELLATAIETILALLEAEEIEHLGKTDLLQQVLSLVFNMCLRIDVDNYDSWIEESNDEDDTEEEVGVGLDALDRLMRKTQLDDESDPALLQPFFAKMQSELQANNWAHNVSRLLMLQYVLAYVQTPEHLEQVTKAALDTVVNMGSNARERFAAWLLLGEFCQSKREFSLRDEQTRQAWIEALTNAIENEKCTRVLAKALDCFLYYVADDSSLELEDIEAFAPRLLKNFLKIVEEADQVFDTRDKGGCSSTTAWNSNNAPGTPSTADGQSPAHSVLGNTSKSHDVTNLSARMKLVLNLQVTALGCITGVAETMQEEGVRSFYSDLMPLLFKVMEKNGSSADSRELLGAAIECASTLGSYSTPEQFAGDAKQICSAMCNVLRTATMADDPVKDYAFAAADKLVSVMKQDFVPFLPSFLPEVYARLKKEGFDATDKSALENLSHDDISAQQMEISMTVRLDPKTGEQKLLCIKTAYIDDLHNALSVLQKFLEHLQGDFIPYVEQCVQEITPLLDFEYDDAVRASAYDVYAEVVKLCTKADKKPAAQSLVTQFATHVLAAWKKTDETEAMDPSATRTQADGLENVLKAAGPGVLSVTQVNEIAKACISQLKSTLSREHKDQDEEDLDMEGDLQVSLVSAIGGLMQHHREEFAQEGFALHSQLMTECINSPDPELVRVGRLIAADFLEHMPNHTKTLWPTVLPKLIVAVDTKSIPEVVQAGAFALSMLVKEPEFALTGETKNVADRCAKYVEKVAGWKKGSLPKGMQFASDNCLACLGNLLLAHGTQLGENEARGMWQGWMKCLPLKEDEEEAVRVHESLVDLVLAQDQRVLANLDEAVRVMTLVYKTPMANQRINEKIVKIVRGVSSTLLEKAISGFSKKLQAKVRRIYQDVNA